MSSREKKNNKKYVNAVSNLYEKSKSNNRDRFRNQLIWFIEADYYHGKIDKKTRNEAKAELGMTTEDESHKSSAETRNEFIRSLSSKTSGKPDIINHDEFTNAVQQFEDMFMGDKDEYVPNKKNDPNQKNVPNQKETIARVNQRRNRRYSRKGFKGFKRFQRKWKRKYRYTRGER